MASTLSPLYPMLDAPSPLAPPGGASMPSPYRKDPFAMTAQGVNLGGLQRLPPEKSAPDGVFNRGINFGADIMTDPAAVGAKIRDRAVEATNAARGINGGDVRRTIADGALAAGEYAPEVWDAAKTAAGDVANTVGRVTSNPGAAMNWLDSFVDMTGNTIGGAVTGSLAQSATPGPEADAAAASAAAFKADAADASKRNISALEAITGKKPSDIPHGKGLDANGTAADMAAGAADGAAALKGLEGAEVPPSAVGAATAAADSRTAPASRGEATARGNRTQPPTPAPGAAAVAAVEKGDYGSASANFIKVLEEGPKDTGGLETALTSPAKMQMMAEIAALLSAKGTRAQRWGQTLAAGVRAYEGQTDKVREAETAAKAEADQEYQREVAVARSKMEVSLAQENRQMRLNAIAMARNSALAAAGAKVRQAALDAGRKEELAAAYPDMAVAILNSQSAKDASELVASVIKEKAKGGFGGIDAVDSPTPYSDAAKKQRKD